jgi:tRNA-Thr(GGU) m(6)t(6)A37 methyltransferase TsaA
VIGGLTVTAVWLWNKLDTQHQEQQSVISIWEQKRQEERTGRIRAEVKLREALVKLKTVKSLDSNGKTDNKDPYLMPLSTIGTIISPYPKRMGTPRQGALVPSSRGCIQFVPNLASESLEGIDEYSHLWVIFQFHENTSLETSKKTKIRPPRAGGIKVGQLSTRSPHRPNDLGLSLVTLDRWEPSTRRLYIKALDLVDGTPVYDVKPYVHWDIPSEVVYDISGLRLPKWVENKDDVLSNVIFEPESEESLRMLVKRDQLSPLLYPSKDADSFAAAKQTLMEILAQDPRSSHRGLSNNQRGSLSSAVGKAKEEGTEAKDDAYRLLFGYATVEFVVEERGAIVKTIQLTKS